MEENISIGTLLRNARELKKFKIEDVASKTKININILRALEEDDIKNLPNIAYLKGFVKNYARAVGVNLDQAQECLQSTLQIKGKVKPEMVQPKPIETKSISDELDEQDLKENMISIVQSFFNKKIILALVVVIVSIGIIKTIVNWIAELNFESNKITHIEEDVKKAKTPVAEVPTPEEAVVTENLPENIKNEEANILEMDASKKFAAAVLKEQEVVKPIESKKEEIVKTVAPVVKVEPKVEVPVVKIEPKVEAPVVKVEPKVEPKPKPINLNGKFPFREFSIAPADTFSVIKDSPESNNPLILPPNFKAAVVKDKQNIFIHATEDDMWLSYKADDDPIKRFVLKKGRRILIKGDVIQLFLGNYRVAKMFYNNDLMDIKPTKSGVRSIILPESASKDYKLPLFPVYKGKSYTANEYIENMTTETSIE